MLLVQSHLLCGPNHLEANELVATLLEPSDDIANKTSLNSIGLGGGVRLRGCKVRTHRPQKISKLVMNSPCTQGRCAPGWFRELRKQESRHTRPQRRERKWSVM